MRLPTEALLHTELGLPNRRSGKVRDLYDVPLGNGEVALLLVATDRVSAFDVVMPDGLPGKGVILTQLSRFWFELFAPLVDHHLLSMEVADVPGLTAAERTLLAGRIMLCRRGDVLPVECIARGYLAGSGYKDYRATGAVCGHALPEGLRNGDRLPATLFTPSTKAASGHDENISLAEAADVVGEETAQWLAATTLKLYERAREHAEGCGIILADTKFEFGRLAAGAEPVLIDEVCTPDSSRFWPADEWQPGREQPSFDKQIIRDHLEKEVSAGRWNRAAPGPKLPAAVLTRTLERYLDGYERLSGRSLR